MAGAGWKSFSTGDLITATEFQTFVQDQVVQVYADSSARDTALGTSDAEGMFCFLKDTNTLQFYDGTNWVNFIGEGDITGVTAGTGISGGGTSGAVTVNVDINSLSAVTPATGDSIPFSDATDSNAVKKTTLANLPVSTPVQTALDAITAGTSTLTIPLEVKVADDGSGSQNVFYLLGGTDSGAGQKTPALDLTTGFKYKFDVSDSSLSGHNFKFSLTKDGTHNSGSEFTTNVTVSGTAGSANAFVQLEVSPETVGTATATSTAVPTLYYYCSNHAGMGAEGRLSLFPASGGGGGTSVGLVLSLT